jgi:Holliday junction resolvasome RuvABC endonuclease subunit
LTASGLVFIEIHDGEVYVLGAQVVGTTKTDKVGWEDTFIRAHALKSQLRAVLEPWTFDYGHTMVEAVHEAPPVGSGMLRKESSILAGYNFEQVAEEMGVIGAPLVTPHAHKFLICGNGRAGKKEHHEALKKLMTSIFDAKLITNEALRDALSIGLYAAHRKGKHGS